jgi:hypothetical protein
MRLLFCRRTPTINSVLSGPVRVDVFLHDAGGLMFQHLSEQTKKFAPGVAATLSDTE